MGWKAGARLPIRCEQIPRPLCLGVPGQKGRHLASEAPPVEPRAHCHAAGAWSVGPHPGRDESRADAHLLGAAGQHRRGPHRPGCRPGRDCLLALSLYTGDADKLGGLCGEQTKLQGAWGCMRWLGLSPGHRDERGGRRPWCSAWPQAPLSGPGETDLDLSFHFGVIRLSSCSRAVWDLGSTSFLLLVGRRGTPARQVKPPLPGSQFLHF